MEHLTLAIAFIGSVPLLAIIQSGVASSLRTRRSQTERARLQRRLAAGPVTYGIGSLDA